MVSNQERIIMARIQYLCLWALQTIHSKPYMPYSSWKSCSFQRVNLESIDLKNMFFYSKNNCPHCVLPSQAAWRLAVRDGVWYQNASFFYYFQSNFIATCSNRVCQKKLGQKINFRLFFFVCSVSRPDKIECADLVKCI